MNPINFLNCDIECCVHYLDNMTFNTDKQYPINFKRQIWYANIRTREKIYLRMNNCVFVVQRKFKRVISTCMRICAIYVPYNVPLRGMLELRIVASNGILASVLYIVLYIDTKPNRQKCSGFE